MKYIATFHTHLSAMLSCRALQQAGLPAKMTPVPRAISASCGTCVRYEGAAPRSDLLDEDAEALYEAEDGGFRLLRELDEI